MATPELDLKAMLHEAIFLATCNARMTNKKSFKLQRGCHTFANFYATCNAYNNKQDGGRAKQAKDELWLAHCDKIALQVAEGMLQASNLSCNVAKSTGSFLQLATQQLQLRNGVLHVKFFLQLATQRLLRCKLQEKLLRIAWPLDCAPLASRGIAARISRSQARSHR